MEFFDKFHALCFGFLVLIIVITVPYTINHGDFFQNESALIIVSLLVTSLSVAYARKFEMISFGMLSKKQLLLFIAIFLLSVLETLVYIHFFAVSSGSGVQHLAGSQQRNFPVFDFDYLSFWPHPGGTHFQRTSSRCGF
ncbi:CAAX amino terminal protease family protein [Streptococcus pneumoniae]|nr:CAAX amino terminal protease family protein [Streptococcus pneumoniae]